MELLWLTTYAKIICNRKYFARTIREQIAVDATIFKQIILQLLVTLLCYNSANMEEHAAMHR